MNEYISKNKDITKEEKKEMTNINNKDNDKNIIIIPQNEFKEENQKNNIIYHPK